jgi:hypothetical protein
VTYIERLGSRPQRRQQTYDSPANDPRLKTALDNAEKIAATPSPEQYRERGRAREAVLAALRNLIGDLSNDVRRGYTPVSTDVLLKRHAAHLPASAQRELRAFTDEARAVMADGEFGSVHHGAVRLAGELADRLAEEGWQPRSAQAEEDPEELASRVGQYHGRRG